MTRVTKVGVYGSLRAGLHNHVVLGDSCLIDTVRTEVPYKMVSLGGFPGLVSSAPEVITIEVYEVTPETMRDLDHLEGYPNFYNRTTVQVGSHSVLLYFLDDSYMDYEHVESGDWCEYLELV